MSIDSSARLSQPEFSELADTDDHTMFGAGLVGIPEAAGTALSRLVRDAEVMDSTRPHELSDAISADAAVLSIQPYYPSHVDRGSSTGHWSIGVASDVVLAGKPDMHKLMLSRIPTSQGDRYVLNAFDPDSRKPRQVSPEEIRFVADTLGKLAAHEAQQAESVERVAGQQLESTQSRQPSLARRLARTVLRRSADL